MFEWKTSRTRPSTLPVVTKSTDLGALLGRAPRPVATSPVTRVLDVIPTLPPLVFTLVVLTAVWAVIGTGALVEWVVITNVR